MIKEGVILAAGQGTRIQGVSGGLPKPLVEVNGKKLIDIAAASLLENGIKKIIIVVGYQHQVIRDHLADVSYKDKVVIIQNDLWEKENGLSVLAAGDAIEGPHFFLQMVDHIFDGVVYSNVQSFPAVEGYSYLCIDRNIPGVFDLDDATKLQVEEDGSISSIAKQLDEYNACDTGLFLMSSKIFHFFKNAAAENRNTISNAVEDAGRAGQFYTIDVTGVSWLDVDTGEAWEEACRRHP